MSVKFTVFLFALHALGDDQITAARSPVLFPWTARAYVRNSQCPPSLST